MIFSGFPFSGAPFSAHIPGAFTYSISVTMGGSASLYVDAEVKFYAATREIITGPTDTPAETPFAGTIQKALRLDRSIVGGNGFDGVTTTWGHVELINADGFYDDLIQRFTADGRRIRLKAGLLGQAYGSFFTLFDGVVKNWHVDEDVLRLEIRDNAYRLEVPASATLYAGTGGLEGGDDLRGKRRPLLFGETANLGPPLLVPSLLVYQVHARAMAAVLAVYDRGVALTFARDYPSSIALMGASTGAVGSGADIEAGRYATCLAEGLFRIGGSPVGQVTCDARGDAVGGYVATTAGLVRRLLSLVAGAAVPTIDGTFTALDASQSAVVGYWLAPGEDTTLADIIADLMAGVGGWAGFRRGGSFEVGIFRPPAGPPVEIYDRVDVLSVVREALPDGLSPPPWRWRVAWGRNFTVQSDVDGGYGITADRVAFLAEAYRLAESDAAAGAQIRTNHLFAQDPQPVMAWFRDQADAKAEADRRLALYATTAALYRVRLKAHPFVHEVGQTIQLTYPRWDLKAGRLLRIVALSEDTDEAVTEIVGFG